METVVLIQSYYSNLTIYEKIKHLIYEALRENIFDTIYIVN